MKIRKVIHVVVLGAETALLSFAMLWGVFTNIHSRVSTSVFTREGDTLRFRFAAGQEDLLLTFVNVRIYYTSGDDPHFASYITDRSDKILSDDHMFDIKLDSADPNREYEVDLPKGLFDFRIDFHCGSGGLKSYDCPPKFEEMKVGRRTVDLAELKPFFWRLKYGSFVGYRYGHKPFMGGYVMEYVMSSILLWMILTAVAAFVLLRNGRNGLVRGRCT